MSKDHHSPSLNVLKPDMKRINVLTIFKTILVPSSYVEVIFILLCMFIACKHENIRFRIPEKNIAVKS